MAEFSLNPVRFEDIRQGIVDFLKANNPHAGQFDFEGSNIGQEIDINAYITMLLTYQNVQQANNIFLDTTEIRQNAISLAKPMGYRPKRKISSRFAGKAEYIGDSTGTTIFPSNATITIPARTTFTSAPSGYKFINTEAITLRYENDVLLSGDFILYEGIFETVTFFGDGTELQSHTINSEDVEEENLFVYIKDTNESSNNRVQWTYAPSFFTVDNPKVFFVEEDITNEYRPKIIFGNGLLGQIPALTETIEMDYLKTKGVLGNGETSISIDSTAGIDDTFLPSTINFSNLKFTLPAGQVSYGGHAAEDITSINFHANRFYSSGGRGVTGNDIKSLLTSQSSALKDYNVVGGNELFPDDPNQRGVTYITAVPGSLNLTNFLNENNLYLSDTQEISLKPTLDIATVISTNRVFMKPTYLYLDINPFIEVPDTFSAAEIETSINASLTSIQDFYTNNLSGLGKSLKFAQLVSVLSNAPGVISADIDILYHFVLNYDSFYSSKTTVFNLPVLQLKDANGRIIYDNNNNPKFTNFIKKRQDVIDYQNSSRNVNDHYTQFTLPIELSPVYGKLTSSNSTREMYNIDISKVEFITFQLLGSGNTKELSSKSTEFKITDGTNYVPSLYEVLSNNERVEWSINMNGLNVGKLIRDIATETFTVELTSANISDLTNTIGVRSATTGSTNLISLELVTETDQFGVANTFYSMSFLLENTKFSDIRLNSKNKLADIVFTPSNSYSWTFANEVTYGEDIVFSGASSIDTMTVTFGTANTTFLVVEHINGSFELRNSNHGYLTNYNQRNDLLLEENWTMVQNTNAKTYEFSSIASTVNNLQVIKVNDFKEINIQTIANTSSVLHNTYFSIFSAEDSTEYYVFFDDGSSTAIEPDRIDPNIELVTVTLAVDAQPSAVASSILTAFTNHTGNNVNAGADFDLVVTNDIVNIIWTANGKSTDPTDGPTVTNRNTTFTFGLTSDFFESVRTGGYNLTTDLQDLTPGQYIKIEDTSGNLSAFNTGLFEIESIDYTLGEITIYNRRGITDSKGIGVITHWEVSAGVFGDHTLYTYDIYHDVSLGTMNYETGELVFKDTAKGYTDFANNEVINGSVKEIFNEYTNTNTNQMDKIRITPIDNYSSSGTYLGVNNNFDGVFNQYIVTNIAQPQIK